MSFNSILFVFGFLPAAVLGYYLLACSPLHRWRLPFLILATILFYAHGQARYLPLLLLSVAINYGFGILIARKPKPVARRWLWIGVTANVASLLWFKYAGFLSANLDALGLGLPLVHVALPLAISFYTFQQIAYLVALWRGRMEMPGPLGYFAFILFFPQLLAGPISLASEIVPQMAERPRRAHIPANLLVGLTIFGIGLFKKTVIADTFALWTGPIFDGAAQGSTPGLAAAWGGALAYTLQIYFDFSGYSDMAVGAARLFGITLPVNFHSPLRATSIIDLWRRWHITLSRFVQTHVFQPLVVPLTRYGVSRGLGDGTSFALATLFPTFLAMLIIGAWHGASWTFVLFGAMHGCYMMINETWNHLTRRRRKKKAPSPVRTACAGAATLLAFVFATVPFRSADVPTALRVFGGMLSWNEGAAAWETWPVLTPLGAFGLFPLILLGFLVVYLLPNTQQIMGRMAPVLEWPKWRKVDPARLGFEWRPVAGWAAAGGAVLLLGVIFIARGTTQFVYFNF